VLGISNGARENGTLLSITPETLVVFFVTVPPLV